MPIFGNAATRSYDYVVKFKIYNRFHKYGIRPEFILMTSMIEDVFAEKSIICRTGLFSAFSLHSVPLSKATILTFLV